LNRERAAHAEVAGRRTTRARATVVVALLLAARPAAAGLTEGPRLAAIYDTILSAKFAQAEAQLKEACPPAPVEACEALEAVSLWWQILVSPESRLDGRLTDAAEKAVAASEAWTKREPRRGEAWFYLAGSYAPLVNLHVLRGERLAAARDGNRIRDALERALALDPALADAYFGIGLYHYYADVAPAAAKVLRWLLLLPGGDRAKGLREMETARERGELLRGEADYQLHLVYLWYENNTGRALELLEGLDRRYPSNPLFLQQIADIQDTYVHDLPASAAAWRELLERARAGRIAAAAHATEVRARLGLASQLDAMAQTDRAIEQLEAVLDARAPEPPGAHARAHVQLGRAYDRLGQRVLAVASFKAALDEAGADDDTRRRAREGLAVTPDPRVTEAFRLSLEGLRAFERGSLDDAGTRLARAVALAPFDQVARYRFARVLEAQGDRRRALDQLEHIVTTRPLAPAFVLASAFVEYARLLEDDGDRARALTMYRYALEVVGGDPRAHEIAARGVKRLTNSAGRKQKILTFDRVLCLTARFSRP
jgi:tetratricopeptide (TPR) repeat protein